MITQELVKSLLYYNPPDGTFTWLKSGKLAGYWMKNGYICIGINKKHYKAHRLAWLYVTGNLPIHEIDHINGVRYDNRIKNLRDIPKNLNQQNQRKPRKDNKVGVLGVCKYKNLFRAQIVINNKKVSLGYHKTLEEASNKYLEFKRLNHQSCTI